MLGWTYLKIIIKSSERGFDFFKASIEQIFDFAYVMVHYYSGISITRTHYKADTSTRRTVWRGTDCFALRSNCLRKNLYKPDISIKRTLFFAPVVSSLERFQCMIIKSLRFFFIGSGFLCSAYWLLL